MANRSKTWRAAEVVEDDDFQNVGSSFGDIQEDMSDLSYCYNSKSQI